MNKKGKYSPEFKEQAVKRTLSGSLFDHIEVYYNRHRSHSSLDFVSPVQFEVNAA
ncbi:hypothetical protein U1624_04140 [Leptospira interrogans]